MFKVIYLLTIWAAKNNEAPFPKMAQLLWYISVRLLHKINILL